MKIQLTALENVPEETNLYIKDNVTGKTNKITNTSFKINLDAGEYLNRFSLVFKADETLSTTEAVLENGLSVYMMNTTEELQIRNTTSSRLLVVKLFNALGSQVGVWTENFDNSVTLIPVTNIATGMYIVQLQTSIGTISKRVIIE